MRLYRKWAFLGCFIIGAILTPPDVVTQTLLSLPLYGLYEFGVVVSQAFEDPKAREAAIRQILAEKEARIARRAAEEAAREAAARRTRPAANTPGNKPKQKTTA
jgi:Sec-independent protein secretion pathway component TatC